MKKAEILRSRALFKRTALSGSRLHGKHLRCTYVIHSEGEARLQIAFKVSSRYFNAVRRNRLRRLMREATDKERWILDAQLESLSAKVSMILTYKGRKGMRVELIKLPQVREDAAVFFKSVASLL